MLNVIQNLIALFRPSDLDFPNEGDTHRGLAREIVNKHKILIVDDDPQIRRILERMLAGPHYEIRLAADGVSALQQLGEEKADLVILDIMMPGMSGIEVCKQIREKFPHTDTQVLMLSAKDSQSDRRRALEYGADDYVTKPFHIASLARKISYMFEKNSISSQR